MFTRRSVKAALIAVTSALLLAGALAAVPNTASAAPPPSPLRLHAPSREVVSTRSTTARSSTTASS